MGLYSGGLIIRRIIYLLLRFGGLIFGKDYNLLFFIIIIIIFFLGGGLIIRILRYWKWEKLKSGPTTLIPVNAPTGNLSKPRVNIFCSHKTCWKYLGE